MELSRLCAIVCLCAPVVVGQPVLKVEGIDAKTVVLSASDLQNMPQKAITVEDHGKPVNCQGVLLSDVLAKVALPSGEKFHKTAASYYMLVEARDGYRAVYAWAELDASFMDKSVYLVTAQDGKPLPEQEGPFRLVAPGEKRGARWVRQVTALRVRKAE